MHPLPTSYVIEITYRCPLRCRMCWLWGDTGIVSARENPADELTLAEWKTFIDSVKHTRPRIKITGGEPFLRPDVLALAAYIRAQGLACAFITSGTCLDQPMIEELVTLGINRLTFSVHGGPRADAAVRGAGAFAKTITALETCLDVKQQRGARHPDLVINCVVSALNSTELDELQAVGARLDVPVRFQHVIWTDAAGARAHQARLRADFGLDDPTILGLVSDLHDLDRGTLWDVLVNAATFPILTSHELWRWYTDPHYCPVTTCTEITHTGRIKANGDVVLCQFVDYVYGNLREADFATLFHAPHAARARQNIDAALLPGCARCCKLDWAHHT